MVREEPHDERAHDGHTGGRGKQLSQYRIVASVTVLSVEIEHYERDYGRNVAQVVVVLEVDL